MLNWQTNTEHVSTHSRLKAAGASYNALVARENVSTHSRLKAAGRRGTDVGNHRAVSTHSRLKAAGLAMFVDILASAVSTHSRLKAAGVFFSRQTGFTICFNTQPPEGGWKTNVEKIPASQLFQHTAA